jgi:glutamine synthetase
MRPTSWGRKWNQVESRYHRLSILTGLSALAGMPRAWRKSALFFSPDHEISMSQAAIVPDFMEEINAFKRRHPDIQAVDALLPDLCGTMRGKRTLLVDLEKIFTEGIALPGCTFAVDITGETIEATGMSSDLGVPDRVCRPVPGTLVRVPWADRPLGQVLLSMREGEGGPADLPFACAPRSLVESLQAHLAALGLTPVMAVELEFYLIAKPQTAGACARAAQWFATKPDPGLRHGRDGGF